MECRKVAAAAAVVLLAFSSIGCQRTKPGHVRVRGRIFAADWRAPAVAHVHVTPPPGRIQDALQTVEADRKGRFELWLPAGSPFVLWFTAPDHEPAQLEVVARPEEGDATIEAALSRYRYVSPNEEALIVGEWNNFEYPSATPMKRQPDGTFVFDAVAKGRTLAYQLGGVALGYLVANGTESDEFTPDGGGGYRSVLHVKPGDVRITFDPGKLDRTVAAGLPHFTFDERHAYLEEIGKVEAREAENVREMDRRFKEYKIEHGGYEGFKPDFSATRGDLEAVMRDTSAYIFVRQFAAVRLANFVRPSSPEDRGELETAREILALVPAASPMWSLLPDTPANLCYALGEDRYPAMLAETLRDSPVRVVRGRALAALTWLAKEQGDIALWHGRYRRLKTEYGDVREVDFDLQMLDPERRTVAGRRVPDFEVTLLASGKKLSAAGLRGRTYLLNFWATWCGPCKAELPFLKQAYERYHASGLEIVGVSLDARPEHAEKFLREKGPFPWLQAWTPGTTIGPTAKAFQIVAIPLELLVGPDGTVLTDDGLRGRDLDATLRKYLPSETSSQRRHNGKRLSE